MGYTAGCPFEVDSPIMLHRWELLTFLHWSFDAGAVQRLLPDWLEVETFDGRAWVGLVPFFMRVSTSRGLGIPWVSNFCETNVRTYAKDHDGRSGIWFFSLEAARLAAVIVARTTYGLPYFWSDLTLDRKENSIEYRCARRWPGPRGASSAALVTLGDQFRPDELTELDHFLTARWVLFSSTGRRRRFARARHGPWPLHRAEAREVDDELLQAAGLPRPEGNPIVHYSEGVDVRIGRPERYP